MTVSWRDSLEISRLPIAFLVIWFCDIIQLPFKPSRELIKIAIHPLLEEWINKMIMLKYVAQYCNLCGSSMWQINILQPAYRTSTATRKERRRGGGEDRPACLDWPNYLPLRYSSPAVKKALSYKKYSQSLKDYEGVGWRSGKESCENMRIWFPLPLPSLLSQRQVALFQGC